MCGLTSRIVIPIDSARIVGIGGLCCRVSWGTLWATLFWEIFMPALSLVFERPFFTGHEAEFSFALLLCFLAGYCIGLEREHAGKDAGVRTHAFVIAGAMVFTFLSPLIDDLSKARVAAQVIAGVGFLGAGIIMKQEHGHIANLTTAASIWFSASIGMAIGAGYYLIAVIAVVFSVTVPRIHKPMPGNNDSDHRSAPPAK